MTPLKSMTSFNLKTTGKLLWNKRNKACRDLYVFLSENDQCCHGNSNSTSYVTTLILPLIARRAASFTRLHCWTCAFSYDGTT